MEQKLYELPEGWEWKNLNSACSVVTDGAHASPKTHIDGKPYITVRNINEAGKIDLIGCKKISAKDFDKLVKAKCRPKEESVLFSKDGTVGKVALVRGYKPFVVLSSLAILEPKTTLLLSDFLRWFLLSPLLQENAMGKKTGAAIKRIVLKTIKALNIPLPPLDEQKRIVAKLDALFIRIDTAITHLQETLELSKALFASALDEVFGSSEFAVKVKVKDLAKFIQYGHTAKASETGNARFLRITDIQNGAVDWERVPYVRVADKAMDKYRLNPGDIVFARSGATSGKSFLIRSVPDDSIFASYLIRIVSDTNIVHPEFIFLYFQSPEYWGQVGANAAGAAQPNINGTKLGAFLLPLPSLERQKKIIDHFDALAERTRALETATEEKLNDLTALKASLLDAAFRGQL